MKLTKETAKDLDLLIKDLVSANPKVASVTDMQIHLFSDKPEAYLIAMFHHLNDYKPRLLLPKTNPDPNGFWANDYLPAFYYQGGFTTIFEEEEKEKLEEEERKKLELEKLKYDVKNTKRIYNTYWWTFFFALVGFVYVVIRLITWFFGGSA